MTIDYTDFLTKVIDVKEVFSEEEIMSTFKYFASPNSGAITVNDISNHMSRKGEGWSLSSAQKMMGDVDKVKPFKPEDVNVF